MRFVAILLVLFMSVSAVAQSSPIVIAVRIFTEDNRPYTPSVRIQVINEIGMNVADIFSQNGMATLPSSISPGRYRLRVSGSDIEEVTTPAFEVVQYEKSVQMVRVKLRDPGRGGTPGTVPSHELNMPELAKTERRKGDDEISRSDWKKAIEHLNKAIAIYPQYASAYNDLGFAYLKDGNTAKARESFEKAVELGEHTGGALLNLARFMASDKNFTEAIRLVNKSLALSPKTPEAWLLLANCQYVTEQYDLAVISADKVHGLPHARLAVAHYIAGMALEAQRKSAEATLQYRTFLTEDPNHAKAAAAREALTRLSAEAQPGHKP